ncbi:hypothetical protein STEG23_000717, partial [Scotinomys teguina]
SQCQLPLGDLLLSNNRPVSTYVHQKGEFASSCSRAFSFDLVNLSIGCNLPSSAFCKAGFVDRLGLFILSQISWTFCVVTFLDLVFSLTDESISSIFVVTFSNVSPALTPGLLQSPNRMIFGIG